MVGGQQEQICRRHIRIGIGLLSVEHHPVLKPQLSGQLPQLPLHRAAAHDMQPKVRPGFPGLRHRRYSPVQGLFMGQPGNADAVDAPGGVIHRRFSQVGDLLIAVEIGYGDAAVFQLRHHRGEGPAAAVRAGGDAVKSPQDSVVPGMVGAAAAVITVEPGHFSVGPGLFQHKLLNAAVKIAKAAVMEERDGAVKSPGNRLFKGQNQLHHPVPSKNTAKNRQPAPQQLIRATALALADAQIPGRATAGHHLHPGRQLLQICPLRTEQAQCHLVLPFQGPKQVQQAFLYAAHLHVVVNDQQFLHILSWFFRPGCRHRPAAAAAEGKPPFPA